MLNLTDEPAHEYIPAVEKKQQLPVRHWVCTQHYFIHTTMHIRSYGQKLTRSTPPWYNNTTYMQNAARKKQNMNT